MSHVYVVALTSHHSPPFSVEGHRIEFIKVDGVFAAIERRSAPPSVSEADLRSQHDLVTAIFNQTDDLLPVRFGAWIDRQELASVVSRQRTAIVDALQLVRGRVQMTIRFHARRMETRPDRSTGNRAESGTEYLKARRDAEHWTPEEAAPLRSAVRDLVVAERISQSSERRAGSLDPATFAQAPSLYHLIPRDAVIAYKTATQPFESSVAVVSGPWPPFAFAPDLWL
jgi:Gas vesicle synthesis protein GvpL/GvpF